MRNSRTCVSWLSPNEWATGSIYGNVSFEFDWDTISTGKYIYWIEDVPQYNPPAYRLLVTDKTLDKSDGIFQFEPTNSEGPIFFDGDIWYRNGDFTGELMVDSDLSLNDCRRIVFVDHNRQHCAKYGSGCPEHNYSKYDSGCIVLAKLIGRGKQSDRRLFIEQKSNKSMLTLETKSILSKLIQDLTLDFEDKAAVVKGERKKIIFKSALMLVGENNYSDAMEMLGLIGTKDSLMRCWLTILADFFQISRIDLSDQLRLGKFV